jgi:hypothetical protein
MSQLLHQCDARQLMLSLPRIAAGAADRLAHLGDITVTAAPYMPTAVRQGGVRLLPHGRLMLVGEELVHRLGPDDDDRPDLVAVDRLGDVRRTVTHEAADLLDRHPVVRQQRDKGVAQRARRPQLVEARSPADRPERPAHVRRIELCPVRCREDEPVVLPQNARPQPCVACRCRCSRSTSTPVLGSPSERRDFFVLVSPWARTERQTST